MYSIFEVVMKIGFIIYMLWYYEKIGLLFLLLRKGGKRRYIEGEICFFKFMKMLK